MTGPPRKKRPPIDGGYAGWKTSDGDTPPADLRQPDPNDFQALGSNPRRSQLVSYTAGGATDDPTIFAEPPAGPLPTEGGRLSQNDRRDRQWDRARVPVSWTRKPPAKAPTREQFLAHELKVELDRREAAQEQREDEDRRIAEWALERLRPASPKAIRYAPSAAELVRYDPRDDELNLHTAWTWDLAEDERALRKVGTRPVQARPRPLEPAALWEDEVPDDAWLDPDIVGLWVTLAESERMEVECEQCHARPKADGLPYCEDCFCQNPNHNLDDMRPIKATFHKFKGTPAYGLRLCSACLAYASGRDHRGKLRPRRLLGGRKR